MLMLALLEGFLGYSLVDDLLSGMGLAIAYAWRSRSRSSARTWRRWSGAARSRARRRSASRMYIAPRASSCRSLIAVLLARPPRARRARATTRSSAAAARTRAATSSASPAFPGQAPRSLGLLFAVAGVLVLLGGLVQINPIWLWGPYHAYSATNGAQPDWYLGWLIGALRLMPGLRRHDRPLHARPEPVLGRRAVPGRASSGSSTSWPWLERRLTGDRALHNLLDRPRDAPRRTAIGVGVPRLGVRDLPGRLRRPR